MLPLLSVRRRAKKLQTGVGMLLASCGTPEAKASVIPATNIPVAAALFEPEQATKYLTVPGTWKICPDTHHVRGSRVGSIKVILYEPEQFYVGSSSDCRVTVRSAERELPVGSNSYRIEGPGCTYVFNRSAGQLATVHLAPAASDALSYDKCLFRLGLFLKGYQGVLRLSDSQLFVPLANSPWATMNGMPEAVPILHYTAASCNLQPALILSRSQVPVALRCSFGPRKKR